MNYILTLYFLVKLQMYMAGELSKCLFTPYDIYIQKPNTHALCTEEN